MKTKVGVISLGCDKNRIETEVMLANLAKGGYQITNDQNDADVLIVNTCAFLQSSREEAIDTILEMAHLKEEGGKKLIVTGCLGQKFGEEVFEGFPEVDAVIGTEGIVTAQVDNLKATGSVKLGALEWSARSTSGEPIEPGTRVKVDRVEGVKVYISPVEVTQTV